MIDHQQLISRDMTQRDLVRHHFNRRSLWGSEAILYHKQHPMAWREVRGNYQNWEIDTSSLVTADSESPDGEPAKLFCSDDLQVSLSRRCASMSFFFRNCDADELHIISRGRMTYETDFGVLDVEDRDLVVIPKGVTYRVLMPEQESLRLIVESGPELFLPETELVDHIYHKGHPAVDAAKVRKPQLSSQPRMGQFEVRVKYSGAFADFLGQTSTIYYDRDPFDVETIDGNASPFKFSVADVEKLGSTPVPFLGGAYLDNKTNMAWMLHLTGGGSGGRAPVHRNPDVDEMRYCSAGPRMGNILFTPQGVDHGWGRGYTKLERNDPEGPYDLGDILSIYSGKALKGTALAYRCAKPCLA